MNRTVKTVLLAITMLLSVSVSAQTESGIKYRDLVEITAEQQYQAVRPGAPSAIALRFNLKDTWHFYADAKTAPGGMNLKIRPAAEGIEFEDLVFPPSEEYFDKSSGQTLQAYSHEFAVYLPFKADGAAEGSVDIRIDFDGAVCSEMQCQMPSFDTLVTQVEVSADARMDKPAFTLGDQPPSAPAVKAPSMTVFIALPLALLAGLALNIMPCVWPVIPIIVMRLLEQAKQSRTRSITLGLAFCAGIMLFFCVMAVANIVLRIGFNIVFDWGDHFRSPAFLSGMSLLMVVLALFMFGIFTIGIPSSVTGRAGSGKGFFGSIGTGFLAAVLGTPCSFGILLSAFAWAQTQTLFLSTVAILLIGVGMAVPYLVLTSLPGLLERMPRPGRWMDIFKQSLGFVLLVIAVKFLKGLPEPQKTGTLYCAAVFAFSLWMWGSWVTYSTAAFRKWTVRSIAFAIAAVAAFAFLPQRTGLIDWQPYDAAVIMQARDEDRPVLMEFTADWCLSCAAVEKSVYSRKDIADLIEQKGVLAVKADTTLRDYAATVDLKNVYHEPGVPMTILLLPGAEEPVKLSGIGIRDDLIQQLNDLPGLE